MENVEVFAPVIHVELHDECRLIDAYNEGLRINEGTSIPVTAVTKKANKAILITSIEKFISKSNCHRYIRRSCTKF